MIDKLIKDHRDPELFKPKDFQSTTKYVYLLDELLEINEFGEYSQSVVEIITREITKKSYRETAKTWIVNIF